MEDDPSGLDVTGGCTNQAGTVIVAQLSHGVLYVDTQLLGV